MPDPRSLVGKLLLKIKKKPQDTTTPVVGGSSTDTSVPSVDPKTDDKLTAARLKVQKQVDQMSQAVKALHHVALRTPLDRYATPLRAQMATLDTLPDAAAKANRLMQVGEACGKIMLELAKAQAPDQRLHKLAQTFQGLIQGVQTVLDTITVDPARAPLTQRLEAFRQQVSDAVGALDIPGLLKLDTLPAVIEQLDKDAKATKARMDEVADAKKMWADDLIKALERQVKGASSSVKSAMASDVSTLKAKVKSANDEFNAGRFDEAYNEAARAYHLHAAAVKRFAVLANLAELKASVDSARDQLKLLKKHKDFQLAFKALHDRLDLTIQKAEPCLTSGESLGKDAIFEMMLEMGEAERSARKSLDEYERYKTQRTQIEKLIEALKTHKHGTVIAAEIQQMENGVANANQLGASARGGWHRAQLALKPLTDQHVRAKALADKLGKAAEKLPALTKGLEDKGVKKEDLPKLLNMAQKLLVEEDCSPEDAVEMAQSAGKFTDDGLDEPDALISSRLKRGLMKGDDAVSEEIANAVGRNVRCRGTAGLDDVKCVAEGMKKMSPKVLDELSKAGITTGICQGPVTDMIPELCDTNPRGWGSRTWDEVPGVYMGGKKMVVVGTMDDGGKRKVPGPGEGPVQHGTPDLLGHEAGHAYDVAAGGARRNDPQFVQARGKDLAETTDVRLKPGRDDYFMTNVESPTGHQTKDDGARSETFAESFALHFANNTSKWPNLKKFWESNPWGA